MAPLAIKAAGVKAALVSDAHTEALYADWREAEAIWLMANAIADNAHLDALRSCGERPEEGDYASEAELDAAQDACIHRRAARGYLWYIAN